MAMLTRAAASHRSPMYSSDTIARRADNGHCIACNQWCTAWFCLTCGLNTRQTQHNESDLWSTVTVISRARQRRVDQSVAYEQFDFIRSIPLVDNSPPLPVKRGRQRKPRMPGGKYGRQDSYNEGQRNRAWLRIVDRL